MPYPKPGVSGGDGAGARIERFLPPVIGHRGAASRAPENTLAGLREAKRLGCAWVEFDVRLTADRQPILLHDARLERTTDGRGRVSALPLAAVRCHDAGIKFGLAFAGERVPLLEEAITLLAELGLGANIELKAPRDREIETGTVVADLLGRLWSPDLPRLLISSFRVKALAAARVRAPEIARGILFRVIPRNWRILADRNGCATIHADHRRLRPAVVAEIRRSGYPLLAYTVNDPERAKTLYDWGVTSVFSDAPQRLHRAAVQDGSRHPPAAARGSAGMPRQGSAW
jgi:glycerophosphoryl diester phosphodiesterase